MTSASAATTLSLPGGARLAGYLPVPIQVIASPETRLQCRVDRLLGEGDLGQVFLASRLGRSRVVPAVVCIKVSEHTDGWIREAYFGQLLEGHPAIRVFDRFPLMRADDCGHP